MRRPLASAAILSGAFAVSMFLLVGCTIEEAIPYHREPPIVLRDLLIQPTEVPTSWQVSNVSSIPNGATGDIADEDLLIEYVKPEGSDTLGVAFHQVYRFRNSALAARLYKEMQNDIIYSRESSDTGRHPPGWHYRSPLADDWRFACRDTHCGVIARYDEVVSVFSVLVDPNATTSKELEAMLIAIDRRMAEKLGKQLPTPSVKNQ